MSSGAARVVFALWWVLLGLSVYLRCAQLELMEFKQDEIYLLEKATANAENLGSVRALHSSDGMPHPPGATNVLTIPVLFTSDPLRVTGFVVALNLVGLALLLGFLRELVPTRVALPIVALVASSPWAISLSRKIWNPDLILPFAFAFLWLLFSTLRRYRGPKVWATFVLFALYTQTHLGTWFVVPPLLAFLGLFRVRVRPRDAAIGMALFLALYVPYGLELLRTDIGGQRAGSVFELASLDDVWNNVRVTLRAGTGLGFEHYVSERWQDHLLRGTSGAAIRGLFHLFVFLGAAAAVVTAARAGRAALASRRGEEVPLVERAEAYFVLVFVGTIAAYFVLGRRVRNHHLVSLLPTMPLFVGLLVDRLTRRRTTAVRLGGQLLLAAFVAANLLFVWRFYALLGDRSVQPLGGRYGIPYAVRQERYGPEGMERWLSGERPKALPRKKRRQRER